METSRSKIKKFLVTPFTFWFGGLFICVIALTTYNNKIIAPVLDRTAKIAFEELSYYPESAKKSFDVDYVSIVTDIPIPSSAKITHIYDDRLHWWQNWVTRIRVKKESAEALLQSLEEQPKDQELATLSNNYNHGRHLEWDEPSGEILSTYNYITIPEGLDDPIYDLDSDVEKILWKKRNHWFVYVRVEDVGSHYILIVKGHNKFGYYERIETETDASS